MKYQVSYSASLKKATIQPFGDAAAPSSTIIGDFEHDTAITDSVEGQNHVFYQHVQDILYKANVFNMQIVDINWNEDEGV